MLTLSTWLSSLKSTISFHTFYTMRTPFRHPARPPLRLSLPLVAVLALQGGYAAADAPLGWLHNDHPSAYTLDAMRFDISLAALAVNDDIDFLDVREDLLAGTRKLVGDSGDLSGHKAEIQFGVHATLSVFYRRQQQDLTIELGDITSINLLALDDSLQTTSSAYGLKWNFYEAAYPDAARPWRTASLELTRTQNRTKDFTGTLNRITLDNNLTINFTQPQTFRVQDMDDDGWQARLLYSMPNSDRISSNFWIGYAETEASSGTGSDIVAPSLAPAFEQRFKVDDGKLLLGGGIHWQITPRLPLQLSYEYIRLNKTDVQVTANPSNVLLPSFLRADNLDSVDTRDNHTLTGTLSYWASPQINVSLVGKLFSNQFLGIIPHYNNPLSGSFSEKPYGYAGLQVGVRF